MKSCVVEKSDEASQAKPISSPIETHAGFRSHGSSERSDNASMPKMTGPKEKQYVKSNMDSYMYVTVSRKNDVLEEVSIGWPRPNFVVCSKWSRTGLQTA